MLFVHRVGGAIVRVGLFKTELGKNEMKIRLQN